MRHKVYRFISISKKKHIILMGIFIISFLLRLYFVSADNRPIDGDQILYDTAALSLLQYHTLSIEKGQPTAYITPLYPIFLSIIYFFFGHSYLCAKVLQALLGSLVCLIIYFITKETLSKEVAIIALFFMSIHYFFISYGMLLCSENLFIFLVALSVLFLIKFCRSPSYLYAGLFGLLSSLATLTRSTYFFFPFMAITVLFLMPNLINIAYRKLLKFFIFIIICFIFPISIWTIRNYLLFKSLVPLGTETGIVLYSSYNPPKDKIFDSCAQDEATWSLSGMSEVESCRFLLKQALLSVKKEPSKIYKYIPLKIMYFFSVFDWLAFKILGAYNFSSGFILPLSFLGIILLIIKKYKYSNINFVLLLPVIYFLLVTMAIMGVPRTRLPIEPYLIIFAAFFVNYIYNHSRHKLKIIGIISIWYFFNYFLYLNSLNTKAFVRFIFQKLGLW